MRSHQLIHAADHSIRDADILAIGVDSEVHRVDERVDGVAEQVAHRGRADDRNEQVRTGLDVITPEGIAERAQMMRYAGGSDHVDHAAQTHGGVDNEPDGGFAGASRARLQHIVEYHHGLAEIDHDVMDGLADRPGRQQAINGANRSNAMAHQLHLNCEALAIEALERIVDPGAPDLGGIADTGVADGDQHHRRRRPRREPDPRAPWTRIIGSDRSFEQCHHRRLKLTGRFTERMEALVGNRPLRHPCIMWRQPGWQSAPARTLAGRDRGET